MLSNNAQIDGRLPRSNVMKSVYEYDISFIRYMSLNACICKRRITEFFLIQIQS